MFYIYNVVSAESARIFYQGFVDRVKSMYKSDKVFDTANVISVRLHTLATGDNRHYFSYPRYVTRTEFVDSLLFDQQYF